jgi:hypothetical protein
MPQRQACPVRKQRGPSERQRGHVAEVGTTLQGPTKLDVSVFLLLLQKSINYMPMLIWLDRFVNNDACKWNNLQSI